MRPVPPSRITLAQALALLAIWAAALGGLAQPKPGSERRSLATKAPASAPCATAPRQG